MKRPKPKPKKKRKITQRQVLKLGTKRQKVEPSKNEKLIGDFLTSQGVRYIREYAVAIKPPLSQYPFVVYYDFYLPQYNLLIEFDGIHHFKKVYASQDLEQTKALDTIKNKWAKSRKVHLLRISCFQANEAELMICRKLDRIAPIA